MTLRRQTPVEARWALNSLILPALKLYHSQKHLVSRKGIKALPLQQREIFRQGMKFHKRGFTCLHK